MTRNLTIRVMLTSLTILFIIATGSAWHKDDRCVAAISDSSVISDSVINQEPDSSAGENETANQDRIVVYYFHTTHRCSSCKKIEAYSREAIESAFGDQLANGTLEFHVVNIQEPKNKHFINDYKLYTKSLIICDMKDGKQARWENFTKVWQLLGHKDKFVKYVQDEIHRYLKES